MWLKTFLFSLSSPHCHVRIGKLLRFNSRFPLDVFSAVIFFSVFPRPSLTALATTICILRGCTQFWKNSASIITNRTR